MPPTPELHPELARLEQSYNTLVDQVEAGELSMDDAVAALEALVVIDGRGARWGLTVNGDFYRAYPSHPSEITDPAKFVAPQLPLRPGELNPPAWAKLTPPDGWFPPAQIGEPRSLRSPSRPAVLADRLPAAAKIRDLASSRRTQAVAGIVVILLVLLLVVHGSPQKASSGGIPTGLSGTSAPVGATSGVPASTPAATAPSSSFPIATVPQASGGNPQVATPSASDIEVIDTALTSGRRHLVESVLASKPSAAQLAFATALFGGAKSAGLTLVSEGSPATVGALTRWRLAFVGTTTQRPVLVATARLRDVRGTWLLVSLPNFGNPLAAP